MIRRDFLSYLAAGAPVLWHRALSFGDSDPWANVRMQFTIPSDRIYLNVGTLGAQPRPVVHAVIDATRRTAESLPRGVGWDGLKASLARILDCDAAGLVFPRNTTEAMNFVANGLDYAAGDEVVTTNHEHIGGLCCWQLVAARRQLKLTQVELPAILDDPRAVLQRIEEALTPRTRVVSVSHVNFTTGFVMPVREIVQLCRARNIISVIDGAHPPGLMRVSIRAIDPDFYASSPHKWLLAPQGTGLLYMREEWRTHLWPTLASGDWDNKELGAHRFNHLGTLDESRLAGLQAALDFHELVGPDRVYTRIEQLRQRLLSGLAQIEGIQLATPADERARGMVSFKISGLASEDLQKKLGEHNVRTRVIGEYDYGWLRLSPHVYNSMEEIDRAVELIASA